jgi:hypothetical protein
MKRSLAAVLAAFLALAVCSAVDAFPTYGGPGGQSMPPVGVVCVSLSGVVEECGYQDGPFTGAVAMTPDQTYAPQRSLAASCTAGGSVSVTLADGSTLAWPVGVGWQREAFAATAVNGAGTTATCTYANLK